MFISLVLSASNAFENEMLCRAFKRRRRQFKVVACGVTRNELVEQIAAHHPDVVLVSMEMANESMVGFQDLRELRQISSSTRTVMVLNRCDREQVVEAFSLGARGVFCKDGGFEALCKCIHSVHAGEIWADGNQLQWVVRALAEREPVRIVSAAGIPLLTKREEQIVRMVAEGIPTGDISKSLGLSAHTVKNYLFTIYEKLGVSSRVELVLYALSKHDPLAGGNDPSKHSSA